MGSVQPSNWWAVSFQLSSVTEPHSQANLIYGQPAERGKFRVNAFKLVDFDHNCRRFPGRPPSNFTSCKAGTFSHMSSKVFKGA